MNELHYPAMESTGINDMSLSHRESVPYPLPYALSFSKDMGGNLIACVTSNDGEVIFRFDRQARQKLIEIINSK
jgi:hypothetical protein